MSKLQHAAVIRLATAKLIGSYDTGDTLLNEPVLHRTFLFSNVIYIMALVFYS